MRRILVSMLFALLLVCSVVGLKSALAQYSPGQAPVLVAVGGLPPPPPMNK